MTTEYLYKYLGKLEIRKSDSLNYVKRIFTYSEIFLSPASNFNDPFDCSFTLDYIGSHEEKREFYVNELMKEPGREEHERAELTNVVDRGINISTMNSQISESVLKEYSAKIRNLVGVFCLTSKNDNILMWSHYSSKHQGFCLQFKYVESPFFQNSIEIPQKVEYSTQYPVINLLKSFEHEEMKKMFLVKAPDWTYEDEFRVVEQDSGVKKFFDHLLTGVIFGCKMPEEHKILIRDWAFKRRIALKFYQAQIKDKEYGFEINEIDWRNHL